MQTPYRLRTGGWKVINLEESKVLSMLPPVLQKDSDIIAAAKALDKSTCSINKLTNKLNFVVNPNLTDHNLLDALAADFHVDFYNKDFPIETKQKLIEESMILHMEKGTAKAVEDLITAVFGEGQVQEWFEYGGQPFHFKVITSNREVTNERALEFIRALESVKRKSAVLESVNILQAELMNIYIGAVVHTGGTYLFRQVV